jgi:hypothetical protein
MHSAIFAAVQPTNPSQPWFEFVEGTNKNPKINQNAERLAPGVFLVNFRKSPAALGLLICAAETSAIAYRILPLAEAPQWLPVGFDPKTIQAQNG